MHALNAPVNEVGDEVRNSNGRWRQHSDRVTQFGEFDAETREVHDVGVAVHRDQQNRRRLCRQ